MKIIRKNQMEMLDTRNTVTDIRKIPLTSLLIDLKEPKKEEHEVNGK